MVPQHAQEEDIYFSKRRLPNVLEKFRSAPNGLELKQYDDRACSGNTSAVNKMNDHFRDLLEAKNEATSVPNFRRNSPIAAANDFFCLGLLWC